MKLKEMKVPDGLLDVKVLRPDPHGFFESSLEPLLIIETNIDGLNEALSTFPFVIGVWGKVEADLRKLLTDLKFQLDYLDAELHDPARKRLESDGVKPTVDGIKTKVMLHPKRRKLAQQIVDAETDLGIVTAARQALYSKKDCAIEVARNMRAEMDHNLYVAKEKMKELYKGGKE